MTDLTAWPHLLNNDTAADQHISWRLSINQLLSLMIHVQVYTNSMKKKKKQTYCVSKQVQKCYSLIQQNEGVQIFLCPMKTRTEKF